MFLEIFFRFKIHYFKCYLASKGFKCLANHIVIFAVCLSDDIFLNFQNLRYSPGFLAHIKYSIIFYVFKLKLILKNSATLEKTLSEVKPFFRKNFSESKHYDQLFNKITKKDTPLYKQFAAYFLNFGSTNRKPNGIFISS